MEIVHASSSWRDQKRIIDYFDAAHADGSAVRFLKALDETVALIAAFPDIGSEWESSNPRCAGLRYCLVKGFENYVVVYRRYEPHVLITRVFHTSQNIEEQLGN